VVAGSTIYCIDTSSIFKWYVEVYPPTIFPGLQRRIEELIVAGRLRAPKAVFDEIKPGDDCHKWVKSQTQLSKTRVNALMLRSSLWHASRCARGEGVHRAAAPPPHHHLWVRPGWSYMLISLAKSADEPGNAMVLNRQIALLFWDRSALISLFSFSTISVGVFLGTPTPHQVLTS
jgi:hypothetical protein